MTPLDRQALGAATRCTCFNLRKATRAVTQLYDQALRPTGLRVTQFSLLAVLRLAGRVPMTRLADEVVMDRTTLSRNLDVLERDGLVWVEPGLDARVREVELTRAGVAKLEEAFPRWQEAQRTIRRSLGQRRMERMLEDLARAVSAVTV
ncbi:MAG TPA: MarR family winged helix-turn-helix transcriptional regulator [Gemmatimonadales bacterium]|jgi:DNA-binding MarR family transcriptional regulator|nr:MarR family winged helix-turn-helix transcriptional regulator [Gemmatimonadales bacterium]